MTQPVFQSLLVDHIWMLLLLQRTFTEGPELMLLHLVVDHFYGCFPYFRGLFQQAQDSAYNLTFKLFPHCGIVVFEWSTMRNLAEGPALSVRHFQNIQREVIYFLFVVIRKWKAAVNCKKIVAYTVKVVKFLTL